ncbi:MAG: cytochrome c [Xanthobacteraceae bacterium]|uniref:SorU family sulfite dehydrogenase c-type cytochrome subunit n=1 Tax=Pseudolabrys sp. TaxID=1960880 RepID=UPI003D100EF4
MTIPNGPRWALYPLRLIPSLAVLWLAATVAAQAAEPDKALGEKVFNELSEPQCKLCHTLAAAGAEGEVGPNLDELKPTEEKIRLAVERGVGNMPPFGEVLSKEQVDAVVRYVADAIKR